jgi:ATP-dependent RNA helicase RhlB
VEQHLTQPTFSSLGLSPALLQGLEDMGFEHCTPIQAKTLPLALQGRDVAGQAQTGTGKTAAFLLATLNQLLHYSEISPESAEQRPVRAIVLAPTRELAVQIHRDAEALGRHTGLDYALVYGGASYETQKAALARGADLVIGTPGRIIDLLKQGVLVLRHIEVVVLDEADRMFDLGFISDIRYILRRMPAADQRLNLLFSATMSLRVHELAYEHMNGPQVIEVEPEQVTAREVRQRLYHVAQREKIPLLLGLLRSLPEHSKVLVFVNTRRGADEVAGYLLGNDFNAGVLSGEIPQKHRQKLLGRFQSGESDILVATDVAARGLHIPHVSHVINFDVPEDPQDYVHRIGRTARAGASGDAITLACERYVYSLPDIEAFIGQRIPVEGIADELLVEPRRPVRLRAGRTDRKPRHGSKGQKAAPESDTATAESGSRASGSAEATAAPKRRRRRRRKPPPPADQS